MRQISGEEFKNLLYSNKLTEEDYEVTIQSSLTIDLEEIKIKEETKEKNIFLNNITFSGKPLYFTNKKKEFKKTIHFENCTFNCKIEIKAFIDDIAFFSSTFNCNKFEIKNSEIGTLQFNNRFDTDTIKNTFKKGNLVIDNSTFNSVFSLEEIVFEKESTLEINKCTFQSDFELQGLTFQEKLNLEIYNSTFNNKNTFNINFRNKENQLNFRIDGCQFFESTYFENFHNALNSNLFIANSNFKKYIDFEQFIINNFTVGKTIFSDNVSFKKSIYNTLKLDKVAFEKFAWFDEIKIKNYDRSTITTIKQQFQKTDNRIDYNRFRSYELATHYKELSIWTNFKDTSILWATKYSTDFGLNWTKAICFIFIWSFPMYLLYLIAYIISSHQTFNIPNNCETFLVNYLNFINPLDFLKEKTIDKAKEYLFPLIIYILNKIVVAFGIYEMIQSFRKFKA